MAKQTTVPLPTMHTHMIAKLGWSNEFLLPASAAAAILPLLVQGYRIQRDSIGGRDILYADGRIDFSTEFLRNTDEVIHPSVPQEVAKSYVNTLKATKELRNGECPTLEEMNFTLWHAATTTM